MQVLTRKNVDQKFFAPARILQFGGGNFLRAFSDWMFQILNEETDFEGSIVVVKPTPRGDYTDLRNQEGLFHVLLNGIREGKAQEEIRLIQCVQEIIHPYTSWADFLKSAEYPELRFILSNTTESGIKFNRADQKPLDSCPNEFPAKLCFWLWHRYMYFKAASDKGCIILPLELIADNGAALKAAVLAYADSWKLESGFKDWIDKHNTFCNTLVDRIVSGYPSDRVKEVQEKTGFQDELLVAGELYHSWIIEAPDFVANELPFDQTQLNVTFTQDLDIHRKIKVRILNGAHTSMVPVGILAGLELVSEGIEHPLIGPYIQHLLVQEVLPQINYDKQALEQFAQDVIDRFKNTRIRHKLISIALNSSSKFTTRLLPSLLDHVKQQEKLPAHIVFAWAALICLYKGEWNGKKIELKDDPEVLSYFKDIWKNEAGNYSHLVEKVLKRTDIWGKDLREMAELKEALSGFVELIVSEGMEGALQQLMNHISS